MQTIRNSGAKTDGESKIKRRFRSKQERRQIAEESFQAGISAAAVARKHGVNANQVFLWRRLYQQGLLDTKPALTQLMPVRLTTVINDSAENHHGITHNSGMIHLELGRARIRLEGFVDHGSLRIILEHFTGRPDR